MIERKPAGREPSEKEIIEALGKGLFSFRMFMERLSVEQDARFYMHVIRLLTVIYEKEKEGSYLQLNHACRFIPASNDNTCLNYIHEAETRGFISIRKSDSDNRKKVIYPNKELIDFVEEGVKRAIAEAKDFTSTV